MTERWLPVPGYEGFYVVSDQGRVASLRHSDGPRAAPYVLRPSMWCGRPTVNLSGGRPVRRASVARLVLEAFVGPCPKGMECCHANDVPTDNRLENLRWDTRRANVLDAYRNGRHERGERRHNARLREADIAPLRAAFGGGESSTSIAARLGVSPRTVRDAATGRTWSHLPGATCAPKPEPRPPRGPDPRRRFFTWQGETVRLATLARRYGLSPSTLSRRLDDLGWDLERALAEPVDVRRQPRALRLAAAGDQDVPA
jgi:AraC-like DNA-binding protein